MSPKTECFKHIVFLLSFLVLPGGSALGSEWYTTPEKDQLGLHPGNKLNREEAARVEQALGEVGLTGFQDRLPGSLSGGQKQRAALARCLVREKPLLLLDEPFSSLDESLREEMLDLVDALREEKSLTLLVATHQRRDAERIADRIVVLGEGRVLEEEVLTGN